MIIESIQCRRNIWDILNEFWSPITWFANEIAGLGLCSARAKGFSDKALPTFSCFYRFSERCLDVIPCLLIRQVPVDNRLSPRYPQDFWIMKCDYWGVYRPLFYISVTIVATTKLFEKRSNENRQMALLVWMYKNEIMNGFILLRFDYLASTLTNKPAWPLGHG